jgi:hypothetical protein
MTSNETTVADQATIPDADIVKVVQAYYTAVDSGDVDQVANAYLAAPFTVLKFNADDPIVTVDAIREFSARFFQVADIEHSMVDVWANPLMGNVVPVDLTPPDSALTTVTVVSTALPTFTVGSARTRLALPATSIFTIDVQTHKLVSAHNMFDIAKVYAAVGS